MKLPPNKNSGLTFAVINPDEDTASVYVTPEVCTAVRSFM